MHRAAARMCPRLRKVPTCFARETLLRTCIKAAAHVPGFDEKNRHPAVLICFMRTLRCGRIPQALQKCGARLDYGGQQSAVPVAKLAAELKARGLRHSFPAAQVKTGQTPKKSRLDAALFHFVRVTA